jgi:hypothetical protein
MPGNVTKCQTADIWLDFLFDEGQPRPAKVVDELWRAGEKLCGLILIRNTTTEKSKTGYHACIACRKSELTPWFRPTTFRRSRYHAAWR